MHIANTGTMPLEREGRQGLTGRDADTRLPLRYERTCVSNHSSITTRAVSIKTGGKARKKRVPWHEGDIRKIGVAGHT